MKKKKCDLQAGERFGLVVSVRDVPEATANTWVFRCTACGEEKPRSVGQVRHAAGKGYNVCPCQKKEKTAATVASNKNKPKKKSWDISKMFRPVPLYIRKREQKLQKDRLIRDRGHSRPHTPKDEIDLFSDDVAQNNENLS